MTSAEFPEPTAKVLDRLGDLVAALPSFVVAMTFLVTWLRPTSYGALTVKRLIAVMLLEFLVVHSAGFMGTIAVSDAPKGKKVRSLVGFVVFYFLMAFGMVVVMKSWLPLLAFAVLLLSRLFGVILGRAPDEQGKRYVQSSWGFGVAAYLFATFATVIFPVPRLGITREVASAQDFGSVSGLWISEPHRPIAMGVIYFTLVGLWTLYAPLYLARSKNAGV